MKSKLSAAFYLLGVAAIALALLLSAEAKAQDSVSGSSTATVFDDPGTVLGADPNTLPCTGSSPISCSTGATSVLGAHTKATITSTAAIAANPTTIVAIVPGTTGPVTQISSVGPVASFGGDGYAFPSPNSKPGWPERSLGPRSS